MRKSVSIQVHGHRGARGILPENSLPGIEYAIAAGCDAVEVDICVSKDDVLVVHHDPILQRCKVRDADGQWVKGNERIRDYDMPSLAGFDIGSLQPGSKDAAQFASQRALPNVSIPTLSDVIALIEEISASTVFNIELKSTPYSPKLFPPLDRYVELVVDFIETRKIIDRTFLQSFDWRLPIAVKSRLPALKIGLTSDQQVHGKPRSPAAGHAPDLAGFDSLPQRIKASGAQVWSSNHLDVDAQSVQTAHELGLEVYVWTVNETQDTKRMIAAGVDAIITDYPLRIIEPLGDS